MTTSHARNLAHAYFDRNCFVKCFFGLAALFYT